jgi:hypothetical protein
VSHFVGDEYSGITKSIEGTVVRKCKVEDGNAFAMAKLEQLLSEEKEKKMR